jgi:transcriptional regulator with XRE-family HTH domain
MGRGIRPRPKHLPDKLLRIRTALGLSQNEMIRRLGYADSLTQDYISAYERGVREPPLPVLVEFARVAHLPLEVLIDDQLEVPEKLPTRSAHEHILERFRRQREKG